MPEDEPKATGTLVAKASSALSPELGEEDWRRAKGALAVALDPQGNGALVSWDNPDSGFKGAFTPVGHPFVKGDEICRAFVAALGRAGRNAALEGTACRLSGGEWAIKAVKPAKTTPPEPAALALRIRNTEPISPAMQNPGRRTGSEAHDA